MDGDTGDEQNDELTCVRSDESDKYSRSAAGEAPWECDSRDGMMRDGKSSLKRKQDEQRLQHPKT